MILKTILVEDNRTIRDTLIPAMTEIAEMEVFAIAETATEALDILARHPDDWHVAVVDLFLREGTGLEVLGACRGRAAHQKVIVLTNYATADIRARCRALGADALFDKSTELDSFFDLCISFGKSGHR
jgi:DNA-binding NarL/FixJ family response regulator